jgi:hypothetical protein
MFIPNLLWSQIKVVFRNYGRQKIRASGFWLRASKFQELLARRTSATCTTNICHALIYINNSDLGHSMVKHKLVWDALPKTCVKCRQNQLENKVARAMTNLDLWSSIVKRKLVRGLVILNMCGKYRHISLENDLARAMTIVFLKIETVTVTVTFDPAPWTLSRSCHSDTEHLCIITPTYSHTYIHTYMYGQDPITISATSLHEGIPGIMNIIQL